jgi:hypothetical protein
VGSRSRLVGLRENWIFPFPTKGVGLLAIFHSKHVSLARELGSGGVWITLTHDPASVGQAEDLLRSVEARRLSVPVYW